MATTLINVLQVAVVARLLPPADFGLMATTLIVTSITQVLMEMGFGAALIQRKNPTSDEICTLLWSNVALGVLAFAGIFALAPSIASFYSEDRLIPLIKLTSLSFLFLPWGLVYQALLQRNLAFSSLAKLEIISAIVGTSVTLGATVVGRGVISLAAGTLAGAFVRTALLIGTGSRYWRIRLLFRYAHLRDYLSFAGYQTGERLVNYLTANMDYIMVGKFCGPAALGIYKIAYELAVTPLMRVNPIVTRVVFPAFARLQDNNASLRQGYLKVSKSIALVTFPMYFGLAATAPELVPLLYGARWSEAIPLLQILALVGASKSLSNLSGTLLLAKGKTQLGFILNLMLAAASTVVFYFAARHSAVAVAWSWLLLCAAYWAISWKWTYQDTVQLCAVDLIRIVIVPLWVSTIMGGAVFFLSKWFGYAGMAVWGRFLLAVVVGIIIYVTFCWRLERPFIEQVLGLVLPRSLLISRSAPARLEGHSPIN